MSEPKSGMIQVVRNGYLVYEMPSYQCILCEKMEDSNATIVDKSVAWICPECKDRLKKLLYGDKE